MKDQYVLAFDVGTTGVKTVIINFDGEVVQDYSVDYPLIQEHPSWAEQDPMVLWEALCNASKNVTVKSKINVQNIKGIVIAAPWKNIIPIDKDGNILRNSIIWMDARAAKEAAELNEKMGEFVGTGQEYWPRLMWVKQNEPEIWAKAKHILGLNSFFKWKMTDNIYNEPHDNFMSSFNDNLNNYYSRILERAGLTEDLDKFPPVKHSTEEVGKLTEKAAKELGLIPGISVFGGFGDLPAITIGTGCCQNGMVHIYIGTSSWLVSIMNDRIPGFAPQYFTFDANHEGSLFALQTGGLAFDWSVEQFYHAERKILGNKVFKFVNDDLKDVTAGSDRLIATHWLNGELPPFAKNAKALFFNLTSSHDRRHMVKAVMEGICYTHRMYIEKYEKNTGKEIESIRVVGGGATSELWMQILADVLQKRVEVPRNPKYSGAMGAYYCAMVGMGILEDYAAIYDAVSVEKTFIPNSKNKKTYDELFSIYSQLYPTLKPLYDEINEVY